MKAYEMRISDWSSDLCPSDLEGMILVHDAYRAARNNLLDRQIIFFRGQLHESAGAVEHRDHGPCRLDTARVDVGLNAREALAKPRDRQSVVLGTSVSVRVDLGGRSIIKKKINSKKNRR